MEEKARRVESTLLTGHLDQNHTVKANLFSLDSSDDLTFNEPETVPYVYEPRIIKQILDHQHDNKGFKA